MRESRTYGFVRGAHSDLRPYRDPISILIKRVLQVATTLQPDECVSQTIMECFRARDSAILTT